MSARCTVVFAGPRGDALFEELGARIASAKIAVVRVGLDAAEADDEKHEQRVREAAAKLDEPYMLGGFSLGARIAVRLCPELGPLGLVCVGYPFHRARDPRDRHGLEALERAQSPTLIIQGSRDNHGSEAEVRGYALSPNVEVHWLTDASHRLSPRGAGGRPADALIEEAVRAALTFVDGRA